MRINEKWYFYLECFKTFLKIANFQTFSDSHSHNSRIRSHQEDQEDQRAPGRCRIRTASSAGAGETSPGNLSLTTNGGGADLKFRIFYLLKSHFKKMNQVYIYIFKVTLD